MEPGDIERHREHGWQLGGLPAWALPIKVYGTYSKTRVERVEQLGAEVASHAKLTPSQLEGRLSDSEELLDAFVAVTERAMGTSDDAYRTVLARALAAAFGDDAKVDQATYLCGVLVGLEPLHVRGLSAWVHERQSDEGEEVRQRWVRREIPANMVAEHVGVTAGLARSICGSLAAAGLVERAAPLVESPKASSPGSPVLPSRSRTKTSLADRWILTPWGVEVLTAILDEDQRSSDG